MVNPTVSVLLVQWGRTELTRLAVAAIRRSDYAGDVEVLVYDNASPGGPGPIAEDPDVRLIRGEENLGFGPAHNIIAAAASGDLLLILNNDTLVDPRALGRLVNRYVTSPAIGTVSPRYRDFEGKTLEMGSYLGAGAEGWQLFRGLEPPRSLGRMPYRSAYASAACLMVGRDDFLQEGGFDDLFAPAYYEDTDLCFKLRSRGKPTIVEPTAIVYHYEGATAGRDTASRHKAFQIRNRSRFIERWHENLAELPPMDLDAALTHALQPEDPGGLMVLWLSPHLPRPDREAGHARMANMMGALRGAGHRVVVWAERCEDADRYGAELEAQGIPWFGPVTDPRWGPGADPPEFSDVNRLLEAVQWHLVVVSFPEMASRMIPAIRRARPGAGILVDDVDLHFLRQERAAASGIVGPVIISKKNELAVYAASDGVITASDLESEVLAEELPGVSTWAFTVAAQLPAEPGEAIPTNLLFLGNFNHHPNVDVVEWWIDELGPAIAAQAGQPIPLRIIGTGSDSLASSWTARAPELLDIGGWVADLTPEFAAARVFLAPLRYGAGTKGKILAALAHGVPVVTTGIGAEGNHDAILDGLAVADDPHEIARLVATLMSEEEAWQERRIAARTAGRAAWDRQEMEAAEFVAWAERRSRARLEPLG